jgi:hypothetical protein
MKAATLSIINKRAVNVDILKAGGLAGNNVVHNFHGSRLIRKSGLIPRGLPRLK